MVMGAMLLVMTQPDSAQRDPDRLRRIEPVVDTDLARVDLDNLLRTLLVRLRDVLEVDTAEALLYDAATGDLAPAAATGLTTDVRNVRIPLGHGFIGEVAAGKRPIALEQVAESTMLSPQLRRLGVRSLLGVPMLAEGDLIGVLQVASVEPRQFDEDDTYLLQVAADRMAVAARANTARAERSAATALQRGLLPGKLPTVPGFALAARYIPGGEHGVGGDWYDVFTLPSGRLGVVIGDVVGHGLPAAVVMGRLRSALRAYALETEDPAEVLARLGHKMNYFESGTMATVSYAILDPATYRLDISLAGHPPPVHTAGNGRAAPVDAPADLPIGGGLEGRRRNTRLALSPEDVVCFYTDGLIERRDVPVDNGLARLCDAIDPTSASLVCAAVTEKLLAGYNPEDDVALVVVSRDPSE